MKAWWMLLLFVVPAGLAQDVGDALKPLDEVLGDTVPPALAEAYAAAGQNITREDVRLDLDMNVTKGTIGLFGLLVGSGTAELDAHVTLRVEMRVISSERIRAALEGDNAFNTSAENATFLSEVFLPAEVFRASVTAEAMASFQEEQERALSDYITASLPELEVLGLEVLWENTEPLKALGDTSLTEPPIIVTLDTTVRYLRTESVGSLLSAYFAGRDEPQDPKKAYAQKLKDENGDALRARDFFSAAAYTQLLNLSMQPGWTMHVEMRVPRGYSFEYTNENVELDGDRHISFDVDALDADDPQQEVLLVSLTHRRAIALAMFSTMLIAGALLGTPAWMLYSHFRLPRVLGRQG